MREALRFAIPSQVYKGWKKQVLSNLFNGEQLRAETGFAQRLSFVKYPVFPLLPSFLG
jgi:hypothetical protein